MKKLSIIGLLLVASALSAQVGIGTVTPNSSSVLDLESTNKGLLLPRLNKSDIQNPVNGMVAYDNVTNKLCYYSNGWVCYEQPDGQGPQILTVTNTNFGQSSFLNFEGTKIYGNMLKNANQTVTPSPANGLITPSTACTGNCDGTQFGVIAPGKHTLMFQIRRGNSSVSGKYFTLRTISNGQTLNEEIFVIPNIATGDIIPFQFSFANLTSVQIQIQPENNWNVDAQIKFNKLQTTN